MICIPGTCATQLTLTGTPFSFTPGVPFSGTVASGGDWMNEVVENQSAITATIDWGDGTTSSGTLAKGSSQSPPPSFAVTGGHTYAGSGPFTVTVTVTDSTTTNSVATSFAVSP
jgi:hypothetical protein